MKNRKVVQVRWADIVAGGGWRSEDAARKSQPAACVSVGYVLRRTRSTLVLASSWSEDGEVLQTIVIPRGAVKSVRKN